MYHFWYCWIDSVHFDAIKKLYGDLNCAFNIDYYAEDSDYLS